MRRCSTSPRAAATPRSRPRRPGPRSSPATSRPSCSRSAGAGRRPAVDHLGGGRRRGAALRGRSFDAVISCLGVMFAPHHQDAADELLRVCRPDGRIGLLSWTPEGFIGQMFATMKPYAPPPPPGAQPPPLWGSEDHVRELLGDRVERHHRDQADPARRQLRRRRRSSGSTSRTCYGPTIAVYKANAEDPEQAGGSGPRPRRARRTVRSQRRADGVGVPGGDGRSPLRRSG